MSAPPGPGLLVTFEGIEGAGKSTQLARLAARLRQAGTTVVLTREPGGTELGRSLRTALLRPTESPMHPVTELLLYVADRSEHINTVVAPALARGATVLCDRYLDATIAYQGYGRGLDLRWIEELHSRPPLDLRPHRTVLLDLDPQKGLARARGRDAGAAAASAGRFEAEALAFHRRVREGYLALANRAPDRFRVISADAGTAEIEAEIWRSLEDLFPTAANAGGER